MSTKLMHEELERRIDELEKEADNYKQTEGALRDSEELLSNILESMHDGILVLDNNFHYKYWNRAMEKISKVRREELIFSSKKPWDTFEHLTEHGVDNTIRQAMTGKVIKKEDIPYRLHDNTKGFTSQTYLPLRNLSGEIRGIVGIIQDTTHEKKIEEEKKAFESQFQQAQKIEAIGTLAGGIAHDFNNLLMAIQGNVSLMLLDIDSSHPHYEQFKSIEESIQSGVDLTKQLLGFASGGKCEVKPTDINKIIEKTSAMFGRTKKEITIYKKLQKEIWAAEVDEGQIEQMLLNFYVNAWQAMPNGGELLLETENIVLDEGFTKIHVINPGRYLKISLTDTGVGIDKEIQSKIFDPFFTTKGVGIGTGLGLTSVYGIIKKHGGTITVYSEKGEGTTFCVYLPTSEKGIGDKELPSEEMLMGKETILLVDDEALTLEVMEDVVKSCGYNVISAVGGKKAVELYNINKDKVDLIILDMIMPGIGGGAAYDIFKEINPHVKVLLSSGYRQNSQASEILDRGCDGFIQKPFGMRDLSRKIREILDN